MTDTAFAVRGSFVALLDEHEFQGLEQLGIRRTFPAGSTLMFQHEPGERVMLLRSGRVKVTRTAKDGSEAMLSIRDPGDVLGELGFIDGQPRLATVTALEPVEAIVISAGTFRAHLETTPRVAVALLEVITGRFRETTLLRSEFAASDTPARLAGRIVELADRYGERQGDAVTVALPLGQQDLAAWTGASRAGVAQALQMFRDLGWIETRRRQLTVRDLAALRARRAVP